MRVWDLWERADVEASCCCVSWCCEGDVCSNGEDAFSLDISGVTTPGFATSFFLFLKLNFLGGSKLFLTLDNFSLNCLIVYVSLVSPTALTHFCSRNVTYLAVRPLIISGEVARSVLDIEG
jgi:hypothetical protein